MAMLNLILCLTAGLIALSNAIPGNRDQFAYRNVKGVSIMMPPYVMKKYSFDSDGAQQWNFMWNGFAIDMMDAITQHIGWNYSLYLTPDGRYGKIENNRMTGMLGEVVDKRADFALADITVTEERKRFVDFTEPFIDTELVILIDKKYAKNIRSFADLAEQSNISYGWINSGSTNRFISESTDPVIIKMKNYGDKHPELKIRSTSDGLKLVKSSPYAFIMEGMSAKYVVGHNCDLTYISDPNRYFPTHYAIAVGKDSGLKIPFDYAIRQLKPRFSELMDKYWKKCPNQ